MILYYMIVSACYMKNIVVVLNYQQLRCNWHPWVQSHSSTRFQWSNLVLKETVKPQLWMVRPLVKPLVKPLFLAQKQQTYIYIT